MLKRTEERLLKKKIWNALPENKLKRQVYYLKNKDRITQHMKKYNSKPHIKKNKTDYNKKYYIENKEKFRDYHRKNRVILNENMIKYNFRNKIKVYNHYSNYDIKCNCCGERQIEFLSIDHINNDGAKHRKTISSGRICRWLIKNNFPPEFQILCFNCNFAKGKDKENICPHQKQFAQKILGDSL